MFDALTDKLGKVFDGLTGRGALSEKDVNEALREIRVALLEADVALPVVKKFIDDVRPKAIGENVIKSIKPGQLVVKIVHDQLVETLAEQLVDLGDHARRCSSLRSTCAARRRWNSCACWPSRPVWMRCQSWKASYRRISRGAPSRRRSLAVMTWSCWIRQAAPRSMTR